MRAFRVGFAACLAIVLCSCSKSGPTNSVTGTLTYKGEAIKGGTVYFLFERGGTYQCDLKPNGYYQFMDVPTGSAKVIVKTESLNPEQKVLSYDKQAKKTAQGYNKSLAEYDAMMGKGREQGNASKDAQGLSAAQKEALAKVYVKLPAKYASEKTTPLSYTVGAGSQVKDFDLSD
jgi:hypothetical protein